MYKLITVTTKDDLNLNGLYLSGDKNKDACIFIHGFTSDFYSHKFYKVMAEAINKMGATLILAQTRGTGIQTEFIKSNGDGEFIGSFYERLEDAHLDISAFVEFLQEQGYQNIVLIGHSLGTIKTVRYLSEGAFKDKISKLILLAPFDKNAFMELKAPNAWKQLVIKAKEQLDMGNGEKLVPVPEFEDYSITYQTFYSWYRASELNSMWDFHKEHEYDFPTLQKISIPTKVILGEHDEFTNYPELNVTSEKSLKIIEQYVKNSKTKLIKDCSHAFNGHEEELATEVCGFLFI